MHVRRSTLFLSTLAIAFALGALAPAPAEEHAPVAAPVLAQDGAKGAAEDKGQEEKKEKKDEKLTLERIFPEKSFFGPSARSASFSRDGRFGAFLYRPWLERRHGSDLYIYDTRTGQTRRITSVGRMAEFQASAREVRDDREKKAKQAGVTLATLAQEQADRLGWNDEVPLGEWTGEATSEGEAGAVPPGPCELALRQATDGVITGEVRVWLVRLPVVEGSFDRGARVLRARVDEEEMGVKGALELRREGEGLAGELKLEEPALTLALELGAKDGAEEEEKTGPRGVIGAIGERLTLGDVVLEDDAEINDEKDGKRPEKRAPTYGGVQGYEWSPVGGEMLLISDGDVYRLTIDEALWDAPIERGSPEEAEGGGDAEERAGENAESGEGGGEAEDQSGDAEEGDAEGAEEDGDAEEEAAGGEKKADGEKKKSAEPVAPYRGELTRLTRTRERESDVQYLPDGRGYTYLRDGALLQVSFGDHRIVQLDPELKDGERMVGYRISPDKQRLVFLANRGDSYWGRGRQVTIVNYRDRFARAEQVTRHMPDDPWPEAFSSVYLYDLGGHETEEGTLERVFTKRITGPRDILRVPEWSPDSSRVAFAAFEQSTGLIKVMESGFEEEKKEEAEAEAAKREQDDAGVGEGEGEKQEEEQQEEQQEEEQEEEQERQEEQDGVQGQQEKGDAAKDEEKEEEKPEFKIENARVVYEFYHFGGPNTPGMVQPQYLPDSRRMVFITELSGYRQLHLLDPRYQQLRQLTEGQFEVYPFDRSEDHTTLFATATEGDPNQEHVFAIDTESGEMRRLSTGEGVYSSVAVSDDGTHVLANHVDFGSPTELHAIAAAEEPSPTALTDSHPEEAHALTEASPEYFTYENRHGQTIYGHMFKPPGWTAEDKRPLLIYVYGGPLGERKMATRGAFSAPSYFFARYMAENHGWVAATIDPRGASGYGAIFEKANFEQVGKPQTEDLVDGARWLVKHAGVDEEKMALHGWSFGGFQTQMVMYTEPEVFAAGIAGAGPTEWYNYNSWYTTGTIGPHKPGELNLKSHSLLPLAKNLKGRLLLVHGMEDSNVLYQDTVNVYRELLKADKEVNVELFLDPTGGHGLGGDVKTIGRYRKYEDFLLQHIGKGGKAEDGDAEGAEGEGAGEENAEG